MTLSKENTRVLSLALLCFQGFGIRIFESVFSGAILLWTIIIFFLNRKEVQRMPISKWTYLVGFIVFYYFFNIIKGVQPVSFVLAAWLSAFFVLSNYWDSRNSFVRDMAKLCRFCMYYSLLHIPIMLFLKGALVSTSFGMHPKTFLYLFYFNNGDGFMGLPRIQGFCWEPSCWNLLLNLNLVFTLYMKRPLKDIILSVIGIVSIMATTGLVVMVGIFVTYYALFTNRKKFFKNTMTMGIFMLLVAPFVYQELQDKLKEGSGNARMGDFAIASTVVSHGVLMGTDVDNITKNAVAIRAREEAWTSEGDYQGYMEQGMVNSLASLVVEWGIPVFSLIIILLMKSPLFNDHKLRIVFMVALLGVLMGTPISRTGFFYMFVFSTLVCKSEKNILNGKYKNNLNRNSNF